LSNKSNPDPTGSGPGWILKAAPLKAAGFERIFPNEKSYEKDGKIQYF
jgi:hypothetical protein